MARTVTITGPRSIEDVPAADLADAFDAYLRPFAEPDARFYLGGAAGIDTSALRWLAKHTDAALTVIVPCAVADQPGCAREAIAEWNQRGRVAEIIELGAPNWGPQRITPATAGWSTTAAS